MNLMESEETVPFPTENIILKSLWLILFNQEKQQAEKKKCILLCHTKHNSYFFNISTCKNVLSTRDANMKRSENLDAQFRWKSKTTAYAEKLTISSLYPQTPSTSWSRFFV